MTREELKRLRVGDILVRTTNSGQSKYGYKTQVIQGPNGLGILHANGNFDHIHVDYWNIVGPRVREPTRFGKFIRSIEKENEDART